MGGSEIRMVIVAERIAKDPSVKGYTDESMRKIKYIVKSTTQFKKDYKLAMKRGLKIGLLEDDVLVLTLSRTGTHSDLFGK